MKEITIFGWTRKEIRKERLILGYKKERKKERKKGIALWKNDIS